MEKKIEDWNIDDYEKLFDLYVTKWEVSAFKDLIRNAMTEEFISILENKQKQINDEVDAHIKRTKGFENIQEDEEGKLELIKELIKELKRND